MTKTEEGLLLHPSLSLEEHLSSLTRYLSKTREKSRADILIDMKAWEIQHRKLWEEVVSQIQVVFAESFQDTLGCDYHVYKNDIEEKMLALLVSPSTPTEGGKKEC